MERKAKKGEDKERKEERKGDGKRERIGKRKEQIAD